MSIQDPDHRGRIQAQGGGVEKSVSWAQDKPPTKSEMLDFVSALEAQLSDQERIDRAVPLARLRQFIETAAQGGGVTAPVSKSWLKKGSKDIRIDIEVRKGLACVPN